MKWNHILSITTANTNANGNSHVNGNGDQNNTNTDKSSTSHWTPFATLQIFWVNVTTILVYVIQYLAALPPLLQRLFLHSIQPIFVAFVLIVWVQLLKNPIYFLVIFGGVVLAFILKMIHKVMKKNLVEKNSLKFSLKIVTEYTNELANTTLEPSTSAILWAQPNPLNLNPNSSTNLYGEEDNPDDEERCIEMKNVQINI